MPRGLLVGYRYNTAGIDAIKGRKERTRVQSHLAIMEILIREPRYYE